MGPLGCRPPTCSGAPRAAPAAFAARSPPPPGAALPPAPAPPGRRTVPSAVASRLPPLGAALPPALLPAPRRRRPAPGARPWPPPRRARRPRHRPGAAPSPPPRPPAPRLNRELLVGDALMLLSFASYKQIGAIALAPGFAGWLAPLHFNGVRLLEFLSFAGTLSGTWVAVALLVGGYDRATAVATLPVAVARCCRIWLAAMPVAACQLVLLTAAEGGSLVGDAGFGAALPLAASGPGEPFVTAAGVLGLMATWRAFYSTYLDVYSWRSAAGARRDRDRDARALGEALRAAAALAALGGLAVAAGQAVGEERLEAAAAALLGGRL